LDNQQKLKRKKGNCSAQPKKQRDCMRASPLVLGGRQRDTMQHPLTGATCVALPNVGMCPQLSCALTFMYLQQVRRASSLSGALPAGPDSEPRRWAALSCLRGDLGRGLVRLDGRGEWEPLVLCGAWTPRSHLYFFCTCLNTLQFEPEYQEFEMENCLFLASIFLVSEHPGAI
jgi:hypothetical protein